MADTDFLFEVKTQLTGLQEMQSQLNKFGKEKTINFRTNANNVITQLDDIQRRLNQLNNTRINLGGIGSGGGGLGRQDRQVNELAQSYTRLINLARTMGSLEVRFEGLNAGRNSRQMDVLIQQYERVSTEYNNLRSTLAQSIEPAGFQQVDNIIAQTASRIQELHARAGDTAAFNRQQQAINEVDRAFREMLSLIGQMGTTRVQMAGLEDTSNQFVLLQNRLEHLQEQYNNLNTQFGGQLNAGQIGRVEQAFAAIDSRVGNIQARLSDVNLKNLTDQIEQISIKIHKLNATDNGNQMEVLRSQLEDVRRQYESLLNDTANPNVNAANAFEQELEKIRSKLDEIDAVWMDKQQSLANDIGSKINAHEFEADIAKITAQCEKLGNTGHPMLEQVRTDIQQLTVLQQQMASAGDNATLITTYTQYNEVLQRVRSSLQTVSADAKTFVSSLQISQLDNKIQIWAEQNSRAMKDFGGSIVELRQRLAALQKSGTATASNLDAIRIEFEKIKSAAIAAGQTGSTFGNLMKQSFETLMRYFSVSTLVYKGIAAMKEMCNTVLEVDTAMTGLYRVTNLTASQYESLFDQMTESAKRYGASVSEIIDATTTWVKLGFDANTAQKLGNITTMYQHVTDLDTKTSVDNLVTAYKGFQDQLDSLYKGDTAQAVSYVADIFDKLGNEFAVSAADVGQGLTNSASALEVAGNTIQQSAAMITGITEVTQNASKAGAAIRTLSMRLRGTTASELQDMGEDVEGLITATSKLEAKMYKMTGVHVVEEMNGELRSTFDIMRDLAAVWDKLDTNIRANVLETIAGKNRSSDVAAMLNNWKSVERAVQAATEAEGTAMNEQAVYMESLQGHLDILSATWQQFATNLIDSNLLKFFVDLGTGALTALNGVTSFINVIGGLPTVLMGVAAALMLAKDGMIAYNIAQHLVAGGRSIITFFSSITTAITNLPTTLLTAAVAWQTYANGHLAASAAMKASIPVFGLVLAALTAVVGSLALVSRNQDEVRDKRIEEAFDSAKSNNELEKNVITIEKYAGKVNLAAEEESQFASATKGASDALGGKVTEIKNATEAQEDYLKKLRETTKEELQKRLNTANENVNDTKDALKDESYNWNGSKIRIDISSGVLRDSEIANEVMPEFIRNGGNYGIGYLWPMDNGDRNNMDAVVDYYYKLMEVRDKFAEEKNMKTPLYEDVRDVTDRLKESVESYNAARLEQLKLEYEVKNGIPTTVEEYATMRNTILETSGACEEARAEYSRMLDEQFEAVFNISYFDTVNEAINKIKEQFYNLNLGEESNNAFNNWLDSMSFEEKQLVYTVSLQEDTTGYTLEDWENAVANYKPPEFVDDEEESKLNGVAKALNSLTDGYNVLQKAQKDMDAGNGLSAETIQAMSSYLGDGEDIAQYLILDTETKQLKLDIDAWNRRTEAMMDADTTEIDKQIKALQSENEELTKAKINCEELAKKMQEGYHGNVNLTERTAVSGFDMKKAGWEGAGDNFSTLFASTFSAGSGSDYDYEYNQNVIVDITPILPDGTVLSPEELESYMQGLLESDKGVLEADAVANGGMGLVLNVTEVTGSLDDAIAASEAWKTSLHNLQTEYYAIEGNEATIRSLQDLRSVYETLMRTVKESPDSEVDLTSMFDGLEDVGKETESILSAMDKLSKGTVLTRDELELLAAEYPDLMKVDGFLDMTSVEEQQSALQGVYSAFESRFNSLIDTQLTLLNASRAAAEAEGKSTSVFDAMIANLNSIKNAGIGGLFSVKDTDKVVTQYDLMAEAISGVKKASDTLTEINSSDRDTMSIFSSIVDMAEKSKQSITDFVSVVDGELKFSETAITSWATTLVNNLDTIPGMTQEIKDAFIEQIKAEEDAAKAYEDISIAISNVGKASDLLTDIQEYNGTGEGDTLGMMSDIVEMAKLTGQSVSDFVTITGNELKFSEQAIKDWANSFIDSLDVDESLKDYLKKQVKYTDEATKEYEKLSNAMSKVSSAASLLQNSYDEIAESGKNSIETLSSLMDLYGKEWNKYVSISSDGSIAINSDAIVENINNAIDAIEGASPEMKQALKNSLEIDIKKDEFSSIVDTYVSDVEKLNDALEKIKTGELTNSDIYELIKEFPELASQTDNLGAAITNMLGKMDSKRLSDFNKALSECKTEEEREQLLSLMEVINQLRESVNEPVEITIKILSEGFDGVYSAIEESNSISGLSVESITNLISRYQELEDFDVAELFVRSAEGIKLNTDAMNELEEAYEEQIKSDIGKKIDDLVDQYESLTKQLDNASDAANYADLYTQREAVMQKINDAANLISQYYGLTSAYNKWKQAQSGDEQGDTYDDSKSGLDKVKELYSEGLIGTEEFKTGVGFMTGKDVDNMTPQEIATAYEEAYPKVSKFFEDGTKGCENFLDALKDKGWASFEDGVWKIGDAKTGLVDAQKAASDLGISVDLVYALMGKLSDYGFNIDFSSGIIDLENIITKGEEAEAILNKLGKNTYHFDFDSTNLDRLNEQIDVAKDNLKQFYKTDENGNNVVDMSIEGAEEAQYVLAALMAQKQEVSKPFVMTIDTTNFSGSIGEVLRDIQTFQTAYNNLKIQAAVGADTSQAQADLDAAIAKLKGGNVEILASLGVDTTSETTLVSTIEKIEPDVLVKVGIDEETLAAATAKATVEGSVHYTVDSAEVIEFESANHTSNGSVIWTNKTRDVTSYANRTKKAKGIVTWSNNTTAVKTSFTATGTVKWKNPSLVSPISRKTYATGTAFRSGNWGVKGSGVALGGEVGQEIVVRDGKFFTIGDNGAEFFKYQKDDIIFNAAQTKELFEKGKVISDGGRGRAYVDGTAFAAGSYSGGGAFYKPLTSITNSSSASGKTASGTSDTASESDEEEPEKIDWIEIAIERVEVAIETLANIADNAYRTLAKRMNATADEIQEVTDEIELQQKAYDRYLKEADSVGLDSTIKELVKTGAIDITQYSKETADLIKEYEEWYNKAMQCSESIEELHMTLSELYTSRFEMVQQDAESQIALLEHMTNTFSNSLDLIEAKGYLGGKMLYSQMASIQTELIKKYKTEIADMQILMSEAVGSGEMDIGSEEYYNMQQAINDVKEKLQEAQIAFEDYNNAVRQSNWDVFDYLEERISKIVDESNFLIELIGDANLFDDKGVFNENGNAVLGLRAVNYDTYMEQADQYAREIRKINEEIAKDPYDTALIERKEELIKLQQDSILAAEGEKAAIKDLVESGIKAELASIKELIDAYQESLQSSKDLHDYQNKVKKNTKEVASLQKQLAAYQNDNSEENRARIQKLQVDLESAKEDLQETQYDQYIKDQKELLGNLYDEYEEALNSRLDNIDALISGVIDEVNANSGVIHDTLVDVSSDVGYTLSEEMTDIWGSGSNIATMYGNQFASQFTTIQNVIQNIETLVGRLVDAGDDVASDTISNTTTTTDTIKTDVPIVNTNPIKKPDVTSTSTPVAPSATPSATPSKTPSSTDDEKSKKKKTKVEIVSGEWHIRSGPGTNYDTVGYARTGDTFVYLGESGNWNAVSYNGAKRWIHSNGSKLIQGYSQGGYIAELQKTALHDNGDDMLTVNTLKKGEAILTPTQTVQFSKLAEHLPQLQGIIDTSTMISEMLDTSSTSNINQIQYNVGGISFPIDHVSDYNDLVAQMQRDARFERFIQSMTVDRIVGGSKFAKYKQKFNKE